ncbi:hypothetical protein [Lichenicoccus roseus]|uniref:Uncharacterized protein n=1 Tax=Lichenicoccus roseus TaxID=2683649 RepID=A0A5R9J194_9PROT|nr:hypothetical protein [Lichenicoccus roseus]TLU70613.1 hypothetical protein FE263_21240 [Lichenicoccus roseus]
MSRTALPTIRPYHPTTFVDRGVAVPFTTPMLVGTRARPTARQSLELIVPNPSGGRGAYIMPWDGIMSICRPTLHDQVFVDRIARYDHVTPRVIRQIASQVAAEGLAGEQAMAAAQIAVDVQARNRTIMNYRLLLELVEQTALPVDGLGADPAARARATVDWVSPQLARSPAWTADALEVLAGVVSDIGVGRDGTKERIPRLLAMLSRVRFELADWRDAHPDGERAACVNMICSVADLTLDLAGITLSAARSMTMDMVGLLRSWSGDPAGIVGLFARSDWMLDGWEPICLIWQNATDYATRLAAMIEIMTLVPILPREAIEWTQCESDAMQPVAFRRMIPFNEDWRSGALVYELIARNERFRARAQSAAGC